MWFLPPSPHREAALRRSLLTRIMFAVVTLLSTKKLIGCVRLRGMRRTVICSKCNRPFMIEGRGGTMKWVKQGVICPYKGCWEPNEVEWPIDGSFKATEIHIEPPTED